MDAIDRKLLALLAEDAGQRYADLAAKLNLSAPALHDRVRKLKARGVIRGTMARLDPKALDRGLAAFIHVDTGAWTCDAIADALEPLGAVEEVHSVAGSAALILKVRVPTTEAMEDLLRRIHDLPAVRGTQSFMVLRSYIERGPDPMPDAALGEAPGGA